MAKVHVGFENESFNKVFNAGFQLAVQTLRDEINKEPDFGDIYGLEKALMRLEVVFGKVVEYQKDMMG